MGADDTDVTRPRTQFDPERAARSDSLEFLRTQNTPITLTSTRGMSTSATLESAVFPRPLAGHG